MWALQRHLIFAINYKSTVHSYEISFTTDTRPEISSMKTSDKQIRKGYIIAT